MAPAVRVFCYGQQMLSCPCRLHIREFSYPNSKWQC